MRILSILILVWSISALTCTSHSQKEGIQEQTEIIENKDTIPKNAIPIKIENGRIILPVIFNDSVATRLILDNGVSNLNLDKTFVLNNNDQLKMSFVPKVNVIISLPMGKISGQISKDTLKIKLGSTTVRSREFIYVHDINSWLYKDKVTGIFPMNWLGKEHLIYIDPRNHYICFKDSLNYGQFSKIPFTQDGSGKICIQSTLYIKSNSISFSIEGSFLIDFGNPRDEIKINQDYIANNKYKAQEGFEISVNKDNPIISQYLYADTARLLNFDNTYFRNLRLSINQPVKGSPYERFAGVIGARILENFIVAIDFKGNALYLKSFEKEIEIKENILFTKWGVSLIPMPIINATDTTKCKWIVSSLMQDKKAAVAGIKLWDELQTIDYIPTDHFSITIGQKALREARKLTFKGQDGLIKILE